VSIGIFSNAVHRGFSDCLGRRTSLVAGLMAERIESAPPLLLVPAAAGWGEGEGVLTWDSFDVASDALSSRGVETLVIDYDTGSGTASERLGFLRIASSLVGSWDRQPSGKVMLGLGDFSTGDDGGLPSLSRRQVLGRIVEQARACFTFSARAARQYGKRLGKSFAVLPAGSAVGVVETSRAAARRHLGYERDEICLIGVLGRPGDLDEDRVAAGVREVTRVFPGSRVLRLFPNGIRVTEGEAPRGGTVGDAAASGWGSMRMRALDLVIHPVLAGSEGDDGVIQACLQHGVPVVGTLPPEGAAPEFENRPEGFGLVSGRDVGGFLEWIDRFEVVTRGGGAEAWRRELGQYYVDHCSVGIALEKVGRAD